MIDRKLKQSLDPEILNLSIRQIKRLCQYFRKFVPKGPVSKKRKKQATISYLTT